MSSSDVFLLSSDVFLSSSDVFLSSSDVFLSSSDVFLSSSDVFLSSSDVSFGEKLPDKFLALHYSSGMSAKLNVTRRLVLQNSLISLHTSPVFQ